MTSSPPTHVPRSQPRQRHRRQRPSPSSNTSPTSIHRPAPTRSSNLGPLTTTFTPPPQCTSDPILACPTCDTAWKALSCNSLGPQDDTACWPSATQYPLRSRGPFQGLGFYSPGLLCPTGYTSACTAVSTGPGETAAGPILTPGPMQDGGFQFRLVEGETAVGCCPEGFTCATYPGYDWQTCHRVVAETRVSVSMCRVEEGAATVSELRLPMTVDAATVTKLDVWAPLVQINWQEKDLAILGSPTATVTATPSSSSRTTAPIQQPTDPTSIPVNPATLPSTAQKDGLSTQAIAGISVASILIFLLLLSILLYLWIRKRYLFTPTRFIPAHPPRKSSTTPDSDYSTSLVPHSLHPSTTAGQGKVHTFSAFSTPLALTSHKQKQSKSYIDEFPLPPTGTTPSPTPPPQALALASRPFIALDTHNARFGRGLGCEDDLESPIDGTSPFRLKRGNTLKRLREREMAREELKRVKSGKGRIVTPNVSPLPTPSSVGESRMSRVVGGRGEMRDGGGGREDMRGRGGEGGGGADGVDGVGTLDERWDLGWERRESVRGIAL